MLEQFLWNHTVAGNQAKRSGIYSAQIEKDVLQLFVPEMMTNVIFIFFLFAATVCLLTERSMIGQNRVF